MAKPRLFGFQPLKYNLPIYSFIDHHPIKKTLKTLFFAERKVVKFYFSITIKVKLRWSVFEVFIKIE